MSRPPSPVPSDEPARQLEVDRLSARHAWPAELDRIAGAAAAVIGTSSGVVTLIDRDRQLMIGTFNHALRVIPRVETVCAHGVVHRDVLCVPDLLDDQRFSRLAVAQGPLAIRFYAGAPLMSRSRPVGMLCAVDADRRAPITDDQRRALRRLARIASATLQQIATTPGPQHLV